MLIDVHDLPPALIGRVRAYLDGVDISESCYAFDIEAGIAWCFAKDEGNNFVVVHDEMGRSAALRIERHGEVRALMNDGSPVPELAPKGE